MNHIIKNIHSDKEIGDYYGECNKNNLPFIMLDNTMKYTYIRCDSITIVEELRDKIKEDIISDMQKIREEIQNNNDFQKGKDFLFGMYPYCYVKKEKAEYYAKKMFDVFKKAIDKAKSDK